jgi:hypothetical protein
VDSFAARGRAAMRDLIWWSEAQMRRIERAEQEVEA